jgi:hypothetical protein
MPINLILNLQKPGSLQPTISTQSAGYSNMVVRINNINNYYYYYYYLRNEVPAE